MLDIIIEQLFKFLRGEAEVVNNSCKGFGFDGLAFVDGDGDSRVVTMTQKYRVASLLAILFKAKLSRHADQLR